MTDFYAFRDWLFRIEGGYVNDPDDMGGATKYGISKRSYPTYDIAKLTQDQAQAIYQTDFWDRLRLAEIPKPLNFYIGDFAFHSGHDRAVRTLQKLLGMYVDGIIGNQTITSIKRYNDFELLCSQYIFARRDMTLGFFGRKKYGDGWDRRIYALTREFA